MSTEAMRYRAAPQQEWMWRNGGVDDPASLWSLRIVRLPQLDVERLHDAFARLQADYEILRSSLLLTEDGQVAQRVSPNASDVAALREVDVAEEQDLLGVEGLPDPREQACVVTIYRTRQEDILRVATSKLLLDADSAELLIEQMYLRYADDQVASKVLQYSDYAPWAHVEVRGPASIPSTSNERELQLPWSTRSDAGREVMSYRLAESHVDALRTACQRIDVGADAWLYTVFAILLRRISREGSFILTALVSGRTEAELIDNLGVFEIPARVVPESAATLSVKEAVVANAQRLQSVKSQPYAAFDPTATAGGVCYAHHFSRHRAGDVAAWRSDEERDSLVGCDLGLRVRESANGMDISWTFDRAKLSLQHVARLHAAFVNLIDATVSKPHIAIAELSLLGSAELDAGSHVLRGASREAGMQRLVDAIFAPQRCTAPALTTSGRTLTFDDLYRWSVRMAVALRERGVRERDVVALHMGRGIEWVVTALAVARLGGCYAPIDIDAPAFRVRSLVQKIKPKLIVAAAELDDSTASTLVFDADYWHDLESRPNDPASIPTLPVQADRPAYLLHTSGSSGEPKGVLVAEGSLLNYVRWASDAYDVEQLDGAVLHTSMSVDLTITSLWVPLFAGKGVTILDQRGSVVALAKLIADDRRWLVKLTPSHLRAVAQYCRLIAVPLAPRRGVMVVGGEALDHADVAPWAAQAAEVKIYNEYGPTETTVGSSCARVKFDGQGAVSIGAPIDNTQALAIDADGKPLPFDIPGELVLGGAGVALGYTTDDGSAAFYVDSLLQARVYRTGDRVVLRSDGTIDYLGRVDDEIKLRGFRIQPREIEAALLRTGQLEEVAVLKVAHARQGENLVAFCVARPGISLDVEVLRNQARTQLPTYMVPGAFIRVDHIPVASGGKRDFKELLARNPVRSVTHAQYSAPRSHTEQVLASVWQYVLGIDQVGLDDDYFALGGDSLRSVQITALAEKRHVRFSIVTLHANPTIRSLAARIAEQGEEQQQVHLTQPFELLSEADRAKLPLDVVDAYPLNLLQEGMIYHREFRPKSAVYHAICSYTIAAPFDRALLERAVGDLIDRHPLLRTSFDLTSYSRPLQLVHAPCGGKLGFEDASDLPEQLQQGRVDSWMEQEKVLGFEIEGYPLIRFMAHRVADDRFQLSYSFHHEIVDGWSDALMVTELMNHYMAMVNGEEPSLTPPVSTFRDSILLEQQALADRNFEAFWQQHLGDVNVMKLPTFRTAKADKGEREIVKFEVPISDEMSSCIQGIARNLAVPLKTVLLAAHMRVMSMVGGVSDVLTYIVGNGRPENRDGHAVIGLFVNSLAFRMKLSGGTWADLIYGVLDTEQKTLPYRRYPMAELKRQHGSEPLSETLFFFNNYHVAESLRHWKNLQLVGLKVYAESTFPYCINAFLEPFTGKLHLRIEYDRLQYSPALMSDMSDLYAAVLQSMMADIQGRYDTIDLLGTARRNAIRTLGEGARHERRTDATVMDLIERAALSSPRRIAIQCGSQSLTYAQLMDSANRVAQFLYERGIGSGDVVVLRMERGADVIVAMLGVLRAGAAYVPLDGSVPVDRLQHIVANCRPRLLISSFESDAALSIPLASYTQTLETAPAIAARLPRSIADSAYIIYTSGSTGYPKGVQCDHRSLLNSTLARVEHYGGYPAAFLMLSPHSFDSSVAGIYWTLCGGGTLVLPEPRSQMDPLELCRTIAERDVSHVLGIPSLYGAILDEIESAADAGHALQLPFLRDCIVAGEACPADIQSRHQRLLPGVSLHNEYGPTEATVWSTVHRCDTEPTWATLAIGRPIANTSALVLDPNLELAVTGVQGELWLGGAGLAHGYVGDAALTAERFVPNPYADVPGERLYRTGDICRMSVDGTIEFLGRTDGMIKIQGFRVELAEIERALERHESVKRAVLHTHVSPTQGAQLIAYIVPAHESVDTEQLRDFTRRTLPKYMIPASFVVIERVPIKTSGKVDYGALPAPQRSAAGHVPPRTATEKLVHGIWCSVLGIEHLGIHDDFFELGGESLRALRIISKVRRAFGHSIPLGALLDAGATVASMAQLLDEQLQRADSVAVA